MVFQKCYTGKVKVEERELFEGLQPDELAEACRGKLHKKAEEGIRLFNENEYWHAHEALEDAWLDEAGPVRHLYKGVLQVGVAYLQVQRSNFMGAMKMHRRSQTWLTPWPEHCRTIDVEQLRTDLEIVVREVRRLGANRIEEFEQSLFKPIRRVAADSEREGSIQ